MTSRFYGLMLMLLVATLAHAGPPKTAPVKAPAKPPAAFKPGVYECWNNGRARMGLNFTADAAMNYVDADGKKGTVSYDASNGHLTFKGGILDGMTTAGGWIMYHEPHGIPTVSFRNKENYEISFCEKS